MDFKGLIKSAADKTVEMAKNEIEKAQTQKQIIAEQRMQVKVGFRITAGAALVHSPLVSNMYQRSDGTIYFNQNIDDSFTLLEYIWNGPHFQKTTNSIANTNGMAQSSGNRGAMAAGAVMGGAVGGIGGAMVGTAIGSGGKKKQKYQSTTISTSTQQNVEQFTPATIKLKNNNTGEYISIVIACNTIIDSYIQGFRFFPEQKQTIQSVSKDTTDALKGIKSLKELLDMGAITQEEFDEKKKQLLNN